LAAAPTSSSAGVTWNAYDATRALSAESSAASAVTSIAAGKAQYVICIDPGHQTHNDPKIEPIGPGSKISTPRATGGTTGIGTGVPEYEIDLEMSLRLKQALEARGVKVVMTRTRNDIRLSNAGRAGISNRAHADLFIRVHCGASTLATDTGCSTSFPASNRWTSKVVKSSKEAALAIQASIVRATGAADRGANQRGGIVGFNWSKAPSVMIEPGFLSNGREDSLLSNPDYQDKVARGVAEGILTYLNGAR
jgi:N-acetylmuramoyl-L-alanine amidase